jgi:hypothetical protein
MLTMLRATKAIAQSLGRELRSYNMISVSTIETMLGVVQ